LFVGALLTISYAEWFSIFSVFVFCAVEFVFILLFAIELLTMEPKCTCFHVNIN